MKNFVYKVKKGVVNLDSNITILILFILFIFVCWLISSSIYSYINEGYKVNIKAIDTDTRENISSHCIVSYQSNNTDIIVKEFDVVKNEIKEINLKNKEGNLMSFNCWNDKYYFQRVYDVMAGKKDINLTIELTKIGKLDLLSDIDEKYIYLNISDTDGEFRGLTICTNLIPVNSMFIVKSPSRLRDFSITCYNTQISLNNNNVSYIFYNNNLLDYYAFVVIDEERYYDSKQKKFVFGYENEKNNDIDALDYILEITKQKSQNI